MIACWHCGNEVYSRACLRLRVSAFHEDMWAIQRHEHKRLSGTYTQLANGSRLYRRAL